MSDKTYNGWTNYETWNVKLWLDNDEGSYHLMREIIEDNWEADYPWKAGEALRDALEDTMPELDGFWSDLLRSAWEDVNWTEIAENVAEDLDLDNAEGETEDDDYTAPDDGIERSCDTCKYGATRDKRCDECAVVHGGTWTRYYPEDES